MRESIKPPELAYASRLSLNNCARILEAGEANRAKNMVLKYLEGYGESYGAKRLLLDCHLKLNEIDEALTLGKKTLEEDGISVKDFSYFAEKLATIYRQRGEQEKADALDSQVLKLDMGEKTPALLHQAKISISRGNHEEARKITDRVLEKEPNNPNALSLKGSSYVHEKKYTEAIPWFKASLEQNPHFIAYDQLAFCYEKIGNLAEAENYYFAALDLTPPEKDQSPSLRGLLRVYEATNQIKSLIKTADRLVQHAPNNVFNLCFIAKLFLRCGLISEAEQLNSRAIKLDSKNSSALLIKGRILLKQDQPDQAITFVERAAQNTDPEFNSEQQNLLGICHLKAGNLARAEEIYTESMKKFPKNSAPVVGLARVFLAERSTKEAISLLEKQLKNDSDNFFIRYFLAKAYYIESDLKRGAATLAPVIQKPPVNPGALYLYSLFIGDSEEFWQAIQATVSPNIYNKARAMRDNASAEMLAAGEEDLFYQNNFWSPDHDFTRPVNRFTYHSTKPVSSTDENTLP